MAVFLNWEDAAGRFHSLPLPEDQRAIDRAVLAVAEHNPVVRFVRDDGSVAHIARYGDATRTTLRVSNPSQGETVG